MAEVVAEISGNHGGNLSKALELIRSAAFAECDYAKFQYYLPADMPWTGPEDYEMYSRLAVKPDWLPSMFATAKSHRIGLFASVFSDRAVHELLEYDIPFIKIASPESTDLGKAMYQKIAAAIPGNVQVLVSTGKKDMALMAEIFLGGLALLCPPGHPPTSEVCAEYVSEIRECWRVTGLPPGLSDHTPDLRLPVKALSNGAGMIEKHLKLDNDDFLCVDKFSADHRTMQTLCRIAHHQ